MMQVYVVLCNFLFVRLFSNFNFFNSWLFYMHKVSEKKEVKKNMSLLLVLGSSWGILRSQRGDFILCARREFSLGIILEFQDGFDRSNLDTVWLVRKLKWRLKRES